MPLYSIQVIRRYLEKSVVFSELTLLEFFFHFLYEKYLDNMIVCQFDKIQRVRNKWRFYLKDGIMHLNGKDYVFQKATGEGEW